MNKAYQKTIYACFVSFIVQAIINNFAPLLFLTFQKDYAISLTSISALITINFCVQLVVDLLAAKFVDKVGYRAAMLLAVLEKRGGLKVSACDAYINIIGGLYLDEPAADLAAVVALASSYLDRPIPSDLVAIGEVGLTGELRTVNQLSQRISEAHRLGFKRCLIPAHRASSLKAPQGLQLIPVRNIGEAIRAALRPQE